MNYNSYELALGIFGVVLAVFDLFELPRKIIYLINFYTGLLFKYVKSSKFLTFLFIIGFIFLLTCIGAIASEYMPKEIAVIYWTFVKFGFYTLVTAGGFLVLFVTIPFWVSIFIFTISEKLPKRSLSILGFIVAIASLVVTLIK